MEEKTAIQQAIDSIKDSWLTSNGLSWELAGEVAFAALMLGLFLMVLKSSKSFKAKLSNSNSKEDE